LIKNSDNITQAYDLLKQKLQIILDNSDFLEKIANDLNKINNNKGFIDFTLILLLKGDMEDLRRILTNHVDLHEEFKNFEERYTRALQINGDTMNDLNSFLISLDYNIPKKHS